MTKPARKPYPARIAKEPAFAFEVKQERSRRLRDDALAFATGLVREGRFDATSMTAIAQAVGCSVGALYFRFRDKEALFSSVIELAMHDEVQVLKSRATAGRYKGLSLDEAALRCIRDFVTFIQRNKVMIRAMYQRSGSQAGYWGVVRAAVFNMVEVWIAAIAQADDRSTDRQYIRQVGIAFQFVSSTLVYSVLIDSPIRTLGTRELVFWLREMLLHFIGLDLPPNMKPSPVSIPVPLALPAAPKFPRKKS